MEISRVKEVSKIILDQLNCKITEVWAWGAKEFTYMEREIDGTKYPTLRFRIRTPKIKTCGIVYISLDEGRDCYIVEAVTIRNGIETPVGKLNEVYVDTLHDSINKLIEDKKTYTQILF